MTEKEPALDDAAAFMEIPIDQDGSDPLALFASEIDLGRPSDQSAADVAPVARLAPVRDPLSLDQVLSRIGSVDWAEAVAIVEALCSVLIAGGRADVPDGSRIAVTALGAIVVGGDGNSQAAAARLARMLRVLTATRSVPAPLGLFVANWVSADDEHAIAEFAMELALFSQPKGQVLIQAVYERAAATAPLPVAWQPQAPPSTTPSQEPSAVRFYLPAAAVALVLAAVLTLGGGTTLPRPPALLNPVGRQLEAAAMDPASAFSAGGAGLPTPAAGSVIQGSNAPGSALRSELTSAVRPTPRTSSARPGAARGDGRAAGAVSPVAGASMAPLSAPPQGNIVALMPTAPVARVALPQPRIYSSGDSDVTPPVFHQPQIPAQLLSGLRAATNTLEVIISETGRVERVRFVSTPKRMADMMMLSSAKNWEFDPALKGGQPVRYRLELSWAVTP